MCLAMKQAGVPAQYHYGLRCTGLTLSRRDGWRSRFRPSLRDLALLCSCPGVETPGYSRPSLRDDDVEIPVALGFPACPTGVEEGANQDIAEDGARSGGNAQMRPSWMNNKHGFISVRTPSLTGEWSEVVQRVAGDAKR